MAPNGKKHISLFLLLLLLNTTYNKRSPLALLFEFDNLLCTRLNLEKSLDSSFGISASILILTTKSGESSVHFY